MGQKYTTLQDFHESRLLISGKIVDLCELIDFFESTYFQNCSKENSSKILREQSETILDEKFKIMVVGEFSSGKSTFLNALIKENILPVAVRPTTATINLIKYSEKKNILLHYWGNTDDFDNEIDEGPVKQISYDQLAEFSTSLNDEYDSNSKKIKLIEIFSPTEYCKNGIEILDTPGLSSTNKNHDKVTISYLPNGHTAIMLLNPSQPLSRSERDYLRIIRSYLNRVIFVANKINLLEKDEQETALHYMVKELQKELNTDKAIKIYPLNAKLAAKGDWTNSNFINFATDFEVFLTSNEKAKEYILPPVINALNTIKQYKSTLDQILTSTSFSSEEFDKRIESFSLKLDELNKKKVQVINYIHNSIDLLLNRFEVTINNLVQIKLNEVSMSLLKFSSNEVDELKLNMSGFLSEEVNKLLINIQAIIEKESNDFRADVFLKFKELLFDLNSAELMLNPKSFKISNTVSHSSVLLPENNKEDEKNFMLSMGAGIGTAVIAISAIGGPLGIAIGFFGGKAMAKFISENIKSKNIQIITTTLISKIGQEFSTTIPIAIDDFRNQLNHICNAIENKVENLIILSENKVKAIRAQMKESEDQIIKKRILLSDYQNKFGELKMFFEDKYSEIKYD